MTQIPLPSTLFVYGTLMPSLSAAHPLAERLAAQSTSLGEAQVTAELWLIGGSHPPYPGLRLAGSSMSGRAPSREVERVFGELFVPKRGVHFDPELVAALDAYEGCAVDDPLPHEFTRRAVCVWHEGRPRDAQSYVYTWPLPPGSKRVASGRWRDHRP